MGWETLKRIARQAGYDVDDDGVTVQFSAPGESPGVFTKESRGKVTGKQAAREWLEQRGVTLA